MEARLAQTNKDWQAKFAKLEEDLVAQRGEFLIYSAGDRGQPLYFSVPIWLNNAL